jgi:hypothetical protein
MNTSFPITQKKITMFSEEDLPLEEGSVSSMLPLLSLLMEGGTLHVPLFTEIVFL